MDLSGLNIVFLFEALHPNEAIRVATTYEEIIFNGNRYDGVGGIVSLGNLSYEEGTTVQRTTVTISSQDPNVPEIKVDPLLFMELRDERFRNSEANIDMAFYNHQGELIFNEPLWRGIVDSTSLDLNSATCEIGLLSSKGVLRTREQYNFSDAHHREIYIDDNFFEFQVTNFLAVVESNSGGTGTSSGSFGGGGFTSNSSTFNTR